VNEPAKLSMVLIARDEKHNIQRCFDSFWPHVDEVVLVDTGSTDGTLAAARKYAKQHGEARKLRTGQFEWCDDFSAARNYADSLATGNWLLWADLDDEIIGLDKLRVLIEEATPDIAGFYAQYDYVVDERGIVHCELVRERATRAGTAEWVGRVHECKIVTGKCGKPPAEECRWVHHAKGDEEGRNLAILQAWQADEPDNARVATYLGTELTVAGRFEEAAAQFEHYLTLPGQSADHRAQAYRRMAGCLMSLGKVEDAQKLTVTALAEFPGWPDTYLTLAEIASEKRDWARAIEWANEVVRRGKPDTVLIINPTDYTARPRVIIAQALANLGQFDEAVQAADQAAAICPGYMGIEQQAAHWRGQRHRMQAAGTWAANAQLLCEFDEPEKALALLDTVPFYVRDHPAIIAARVQVTDQLAEPYTVVPVIGGTPRANFLIRGLEAQRDELVGDTTVPADGDEAPVFSVLDPAGATVDLLKAAWPLWQVDRTPEVIADEQDDDADEDAAPTYHERLYDAVILSGDLDNGFDAEGRLAALVASVKPGGHVYVVTPEGRLGTSHTPGRRRAWRSVDVADMLRKHGTVEAFGVDDSGWIVAAMTPAPKRQEIAIWTGYAIGPWHPLDIKEQGLGGSETAAWRIAEELSERGYVVTLYGHFSQEGCVKDVILRDWQTFDPLRDFYTVIAFRDATMFDRKLAAKHTILWLEDVAGGEGINPERMEHIDAVFAVSKWHAKNVIETYPWIDQEKVVACRNGVHLPYFATEPAPDREKVVLYTSSPDRGLDILLEVWPEIAERVPGAVLKHSYSRWYDLVADGSPGISTHRQRLRGLEEQAGSIRLPSQGQGALAHLMRSSLVWVAPSYFSPAKMKFNETSCISAMEAQAAGLAIVASKWGALAETVQVGRLISGDPMSKAYRRKFVDAIVAALTDPEIQHDAQENGPKAVAGMGWNGVVDRLMPVWGHQPGAMTLVTGG
jgi:glycosyltransferase involved in cell wall biosynthesis/tetratricopeptide (TPR) repeat protein